MSCLCVSGAMYCKSRHSSPICGRRLQQNIAYNDVHFPSVLLLLFQLTSYSKHEHTTAHLFSMCQSFLHLSLPLSFSTFARLADAHMSARQLALLCLRTIHSVMSSQSQSMLLLKAQLSSATSRFASTSVLFLSQHAYLL